MIEIVAAVGNNGIVGTDRREKIRARRKTTAMMANF